MIFLIFILFYSVTCCASHHDNKALIEEAKKNLLSRKIIGDRISSSHALTAWVLLKDIHHAEPTYHNHNEIREKISTHRNDQGYEISKLVLPRCENRIHTTTVSYYKRSQINSASHNNFACAQVLNRDVQASGMQQTAQRKAVVAPLLSASQILIAQAIEMPMPRQEVEASKRRPRSKSITDDDIDVLNSIRVSRHDERCYFQELSHRSAEIDKGMQQIKKDIKLTHVSSQDGYTKSRYFNSDDYDSDSDSDSDDDL